MVEAITNKGIRIRELDGIRGCAIILVLIWHYVGCAIQPGQRDVAFLIWKATSLTWCGVDLFFVLSGFLIGGILMDNKLSKTYFSTFYLRRAARIFPLYYVIVFGAYLLSYSSLRSLQGSSPFLDGDTSIAAYLFYVQNFVFSNTGSWGYRPLALTWSLAVEEQFYLLLPVLVYLTPIRKLQWFLGGGILMSWATRIVLFHLHPHPEFATYTLLISRCDSLFSGAMLAWIIRQRADLLRPFEKTWVRVLTMTSLFVGYVFLITIGAGIGSVHASYWGLPWFALTAVCLISACSVQGDNYIKKFFRIHLLQFFGLISYGLYMLHGIVHHATFWLLTGTSETKLNGPYSCLVTIVALSIAVLMATLSWRLFEQPLLTRVRQNNDY